MGAPPKDVAVAYKVHLIYFRPTGKFLAHAETVIAHESISKIWDEIHEMRRWGRLPGLRPNAGHDLLVMVDVPDHPQRVLHLVMPPLFDEDDVTPARIATDEMRPLVRVPLAELPRTSTKDVLPTSSVDPDADTALGDEEVTPVDVPIPER